VTGEQPGRLMRAEIAEQPERWLDLLARREAIDAAADLILRTRPELLVFAARGSSDHAAMYAQYLAHNLLRIPAMLATPASITGFGTQLAYPRSVALAVSQSGRSPDLLATVASLAAGGVPIVAYSNDETSDLARAAEAHVALAAGPEVSVAATKTYTAELLALALTLHRAAGTGWTELDVRVRALAASVAADLAQPDAVSDAVAALTGVERVLVVGRGYSMASAREGALKLMETNAIAASGWSAADATHGPLGQVVPGTVVVALTGSPAGRDSVLSFAESASALGGEVIEIGPGLLPDPAALVHLDKQDHQLLPVREIVPLQRIALELALRRGLDPDRPAGLRKVTMTR
jgi:glucosamine--fructose-6-phosphate aminotransferase (isomerizing)